MVKLSIKNRILINRTIDGFMYYMYPITRRERLLLEKLNNTYKATYENESFELQGNKYKASNIIAIGTIDVTNDNHLAFIKKLFHKERGELYMPKNYDPTTHEGIITKHCMVSDYGLYYQMLYNTIGAPDNMIIVKESNPKSRLNLYY